MSLWLFLKQLIGISFLGFSFFSATFIVSLLVGLGAYHPVLGPLPQLVAYAEAILISSAILAIANRLSIPRSSHKPSLVPRRRSYSA